MHLPKSKMQPVFAFTGMVDILCILLLVFASKDQPFRETLPLVVKEATRSTAQENLKPLLVELDSQGQWRMDGKSFSMAALIDELAATSPEQKILVAIECDAEGQGQVSEVLQLSHQAQSLGFASRLFLLTRNQPTETQP